MTNRLLWIVLGTALLIAFAVVSTASAAVRAEGLAPLRGAAVTPRVVRFDKLPRVTKRYTGPLRERREAINPEADAELERQKHSPIDIRPEQFAKFTQDETTGGAQSLGPIVGNGFEGITQSYYIPSEPTVAAGPLNIFSTGNSSVTVTNKDGTNRVETFGNSFFGISFSEGGISDPQCYYDAVHQRFVVIAFTYNGGSGATFSYYYLAISQTNDARGAWYVYRFDMSLDGGNPTSNWGDYPALGISEDKLAISTQQFRSDNTYAHQKIRIIDRALAYSGAPVGYVDFVGFSAPSGQGQDVFVTKVARDLTPGESTIHCLCVRTNGGSNVTYRTVTGPPNAPVLSAGSLVAVSPYAAPPDADQAGSTAKNINGDCRPSDFYVRNGVLICAWPTAANLGGNVSAIRLFQLRTSDRAVLTDETFGAAGTFYSYPAATVDSVGSIFLGFDRSSSTEYPSVYATGKRRSDAAIEPSVLLMPGFAQNIQPRWGDYTGIDNDASLSGPGGSTAWYAGQFPYSPYTFGTWNNRLTFTYGQVAGTVTDDCDGSVATSGDRSPAGNFPVTLVQGATTVATRQTDASGNYSFGYLESGSYDVVIAPAGGSALDATAGVGGSGQTRVSAFDLQVNLTNAQTSSANNFIVTSTHALPAIVNLSPATKLVGGGAFTLTVIGANFVRCSVVQLDGSARPTTWISDSQLTAAIPASDLVSPAIRNVTVVNPPPGGGTSNPQTLTIQTGTDHTPPTVALSAPVGGESWSVGSAHTITWNATDNVVVANADLDYSTNGGATFPYAIAHAIANTGSFAWTVPGTPTSTARVRVFVRDPDGNVAADSSHANLALAGWTLYASAGVNGSISPAGAIGVPDGATPTFTITPATGYSVADVLVNGQSAGAVTSYAFAPVHTNQTIAASFVIKQYTLSLGTTGSGSVARSPDLPSYPHGTLVTLTATPSGGSSFRDWSGDTAVAANPLTLVVTANRSLTANFYQHIYTWVATGTGAWGSAADWSPARTSPASDDVLSFSGGGAVTATGVTTQSIGRLVLSNNTVVTLQSSGSATLTIGNAGGVDLDVPAGSGLRLTSSSAITIALPAGATGSIAGAVDVLGGAHRLVALGTNALEFQSGGVLTLGAGFSGNIFGTGAGNSALNSVVFRTGALLAQGVGQTPFGAAAPSTVVAFEPGSRFRIDGAALTPSLAGRTYADFEQNAAGTVTLTGGSAFTLDSLIVTRGTLNLSTPPGGMIRGNISVKSGAALSLSPLSASIFTLSGATTQKIGVQGSFSSTSYASLAINNPSGVELAAPLTLGGALAFASGRLSTGPYVMAMSGGAITGASQAAGYVDGNLRLDFPAGDSARVFDIGDAATYTPLTVAMHGAGAAFSMTAATHTPDHPNIATSGLAAGKSVNRYWTLTASGVPTFTNYDATFSFRASNVDLLADPLQFSVRRYNGGAWYFASIGARAPTSTQAISLTDFGDFIAADPPSFALSTTILGPGSVAKSPNQALYNPGSIVQLTAAPTAGYTFSGWSGDASGTVNPLSVTMNADKNITATFVIPVHVVQPNGSEILPVGSVTTLMWSADTALATSIDLRLSRNGSTGPFSSIVTGIANTGTWSWWVSGPVTNAALLEVVAHGSGGATGSDTGDATFVIANNTGVGTGPVGMLELSASPNPLRNRGLVRFALPAAGRIRLSVLDLLGREVCVLAAGAMTEGSHDVTWDATPHGLAPGLYFARLEAPGGRLTRRFVVTR